MPEAHVDARVAMYTAEDEEALLQGEPDFVVDAIDDINTKASSRPSAVEPINPSITAVRIYHLPGSAKPAPMPSFL